jgi:hypothetical protein
METQEENETVQFEAAIVNIKNCARSTKIIALTLISTNNKNKYNTLI